MGINFKRLHDITSIFPSTSVLCVGDIMLDE